MQKKKIISLIVLMDLFYELSSIRLNGGTAYTTYSGGTTSERFVDYLRNILIPTLFPDSIVVMDNMRSQHTRAVKNLLEQAGVQYLLLMPTLSYADEGGIEGMPEELTIFCGSERAV